MTAPQLAAFKFDVIASSDLVRAIETATFVAKYQPPTYYGDMLQDLREMCFGELEGLRIEAVRENGAMAATQDQWAAGDYDVRWPGKCFHTWCSTSIFLLTGALCGLPGAGWLTLRTELVVLACARRHRRREPGHGRHARRPRPAGALRRGPAA